LAEVHGRGVVVLIPVLDDWKSAAALVEQIGQHVDSRSRPRVLIVDDGSLDPPQEVAGVPNLGVVTEVSILALERNVGHQRAIAIGLSYLAAQDGVDHDVVVMDGDGEDDPRDIDRLLAALDDADRTAVVFAERTRRSEGFLFRFGYIAFRMLHRPLTGVGVRIGNFSAVPHDLLRRVTLSPDLWNHYAASVVASRVPVRRVPSVRLRRIAGESKMNVVSLVVHGMSAMAVFGDRIAVRLLVAAALLVGFGLAAAAGLGLAGVLDLSSLAGPLGLVAVLLLAQLILLLLAFAFLVLRSRSDLSFIPLRDHRLFVRGVTRIR